MAAREGGINMEEEENPKVPKTPRCHIRERDQLSSQPSSPEDKRAKVQLLGRGPPSYQSEWGEGGVDPNEQEWEGEGDASYWEEDPQWYQPQYQEPYPTAQECVPGLAEDIRIIGEQVNGVQQRIDNLEIHLGRQLIDRDERIKAIGKVVQEGMASGQGNAGAQLYLSYDLKLQEYLKSFEQTFCTLEGHLWQANKEERLKSQGGGAIPGTKVWKHRNKGNDSGARVQSY